MKTKIISLPSATDRQKTISQTFANKNIKFDFSTGVNSNDIKFDKNKCGFIFNNTFFHFNFSQLIKYTNRNWIRIGEIGCLLSHYKIYNELINDDKNQAYLICEDDCKPSINFKVENLDKFDYSKIDLLYLQSITAHFQNKQIIVDTLPNFNSYPKVKHINQNIPIICEGTTSYIITKTGAKKFCDYINLNGYDGPIDNLFTRIPNLILTCPEDIKNYFTLEETSKESSIHSGKFLYNYNFCDITLKSNFNLEFINDN